MGEFIELNGGMLPVLILLLVCFNIAMTAVYKILEQIKDKTKTDADNKVYAIIGVVIPWLQKAIDFVTGNPQH